MFDDDELASVSTSELDAELRKSSFSEDFRDLIKTLLLLLLFSSSSFFFLIEMEFNSILVSFFVSCILLVLRLRRAGEAAIAAVLVDDDDASMIDFEDVSNMDLFELEDDGELDALDWSLLLSKYFVFLLSLSVNFGTTKLTSSSLRRSVLRYSILLFVDTCSRESLSITFSIFSNGID